MAFELLAAIVAAFACAGVVLLLRKIAPGRVAKWAMPVGAGAGLIGTTVWLEYDWFNRVSDALPDGVAVVWQGEERQALRPWSFVVPLTTRFVAIDTRSLAPHPANADLRLAHIYSFARWKPVEDGYMIFDCAARRQVNVVEGVQITDQGVLAGADWQQAGQDDTLFSAACREG